MLWFLLAGEPELAQEDQWTSWEAHPKITCLFPQEAVHFDVTASLTVLLFRLILFGRPVPLVHVY